MTFFTSFRAVNLPGLTLYQRPGERRALSLAMPNMLSATLEETPPMPDTAAREPACADADGAATPDSDNDIAAGRGIASGNHIEHALAPARAHAGNGKWRDAARCCEELLSADPLNSHLHLYRGLALARMKELSEAEQSLRSAIYLDRQSVLAHYYLGSVLQSQGHRREAARCFENTLCLLDGLSSAISSALSFPDADGITAAELRTLAALHLDTLRGRVCHGLS